MTPPRPTRAAALASAALLAAAVALPAPAAAQSGWSPGLGTEVGPAFGTMQGDDFDGTGSGYGGELQLRRSWASGWSVGLGGRYTSHESVDLDDRLALASVALAPRYAILDASLPFDPVLGGRVAVSRWTLTAEGGDVSVDYSALGMELGGTLGARFALSAGTAFVLRGVASVVTYDDVESDPSGSDSVPDGTLPRSGTFGSYLGVQGALSLPFP